uniref:Uncharacterized protein n=1 Tax=Anopheles farauti TaxID=69004 RepID=A0A182QVH9_9DIPT
MHLVGSWVKFIRRMMELPKQFCRLCLSASRYLHPLFQPNEGLDFREILRNNVRLEITEDDVFSKMICNQCITKLKTIGEYAKLFHDADRKLRECTKLRLQITADNVADAQTIQEKLFPRKTARFRSRRLNCVRFQRSKSNDFHHAIVAVRMSDDENEDSLMTPTDAGTSHLELETVLKSDTKQQTNSLNDPVVVHNVEKKEKHNTESLPILHDFKCYICKSEPLGSRKALIEHLASHMDKVPYTCERCVMETIVLTRVRTLNTHMKMHQQPIKCDYCDRRYSNAAGKYYHTHTYHLGGGAPCLVNCKVCGKQYGSEVALKQHMKYHTTMLKCSKCELVFNHPNKRRNHEITHDANPGYECVVCKKVLQTIESYDVHLKKHSQERSYQCNLCPKKFNTSFNLILHLKVHAKNYNYRPAKSWVEHYTIVSRDPMQYKCNHCERYSTDKVNNMISHLQAHFKEYECDQCKRLFATAKQLRAHYTTHTGEKSETCQQCGKCFSTKNNLRVHLKSHKREDVPVIDVSAADVQLPPVETSRDQ